MGARLAYETWKQAEKLVVASAARTVTGNSSDINTVPGAVGVIFTLDITAVSGTTPTLDVKIQGKDPNTGDYVDLPSAAFAQKTGAGQDTLNIRPGIAETANRSVSDVIPRTYRIVWTIGGTTPSFTFSVGASYTK
jgi:hypothetical protein